MITLPVGRDLTGVGMSDTGEASATDAEEQSWIVAVGASAGGLEPLQQFFSGMRAPTRAAFVVIQHLAPDHRSMMTELLGRHAHLPVSEAVAGESLADDHIYLMPPGILMTIEHEQLVFAPRPLKGVPLPIDTFFRSLCGEGASRCIGVVLSGSGSDGAAGAMALRAAGGFVMAQRPETARFDSMPRSLMAATTADAVLPPAGLAAQVLALTQGRADRNGQVELSAADPITKPTLQRLFEALMRQSGIDFSHYKLPTMMRRIERRLSVLGSLSLASYADVVEGSEDERELLRRELLIPVTGFFRDPAAFEALGLALQALLRSRPTDKPLRIWSAGCATGEESYSIAITALEACAAVGRWPGIKVFATDIDQRFLAIGGVGCYPAGAADGLPEHVLAQWFTRGDDHIKVKPELRHMVLFARHNLLEDAPFTHIDLAVCRNTLIYFQAEAQDRVMRRLQYALNADGLLFLGSSESLGALQADFQTIDAAHRLYRLVRPVLIALAVRDGFSHSSIGVRTRSVSASPHLGSAQPLAEAAVQRLLQAYVPLSLLVTSQRQLIHAWGPTQRFLRLPEGEARLDVTHLLPADIGPVASFAMQCALREGREHRSAPLNTLVEGQPASVRVVARPVPTGDQAEPCVLLSIEELDKVLPNHETPLSAVELDRLAAVEHELAQTRASLQAGVEELEAANEELQATNEELMSSNEELQSTNEELQSVNEELYTVNAEYNGKLDAVSTLNADLDGMSQSTGIATLFIDQRLELVRFTPEAAALFHLRNSDIGRAIGAFTNPLNYPELLDDLRAVLAGGPPVEREVIRAGGALYLARVVGYGEKAGTARRAVMSLIDVSRLRDIQRLQAVIDSLPAQIAVMDVHGTIRQVNRAWTDFARSNGITDDAAVGIGANYLSVLAHAATDEALLVLRNLQQVLSGRMSCYQSTYACHGPDQRRWFMMHATPLGALERGAVVAHFDITPWQTGEAREQAHA